MEDAREIKYQYFLWLCNRVKMNVHDFTSPSPSFYHICSILYDTEFYSLVDFDENRENDGKKLRELFSDEVKFDDYSEIDGVCNVLEMLVALSYRWEDITYRAGEDNTLKWFRIMLFNLGVLRTDVEFEEDFDVVVKDVKQKLDVFLSRTYEYNGSSGLFPLKNPEKDQKTVEIWYQMCSFIGENFMEN